MSKKNNKGFTLMEMLIVVAIIAILIAIAVPTFSNALNRAKFAADESDLRSLKSLISVDFLTENISSYTSGADVFLSADGNSVETSEGTEASYRNGDNDIAFTATDNADGTWTFTTATTYPELPSGCAFETGLVSFDLVAPTD